VDAGHWAEAAVLLNGFNDADILTHVQALTRPQQTSLRLATPAWAFRVRAPLLDADYQAARAAGNWSDAAVALNGFNATDISNRLGVLSHGERVQLCQAAPEWAKAVLDAVAAIDLDAAYQGAVQRQAWARAAVLLNGFNDADILTHVQALTRPQQTSLRLATPAWAFRVRAPLLDADYQAAKAAGNWSDAAVALNGFNDRDILSRVNALSSNERDALWRATPVWASRVRAAIAPSKTYIVPFDRHPLAAEGERVIFRGDFTHPSPTSYQLEYSTTGGHFTSATGPTTRTIPGLVSGNVDFFVPTPWSGASPVQVVLKVQRISDGSIAQTETWDFGVKARYPTTMRQLQGTGEVSLPGIYTYDILPALSGLPAPYYQHQTILERFGNWSLANIVPNDVAPAYRTAHGLNSAADVSGHFLGAYQGANGTFTVDANDQISDQHGGHPDLSKLASNLATPKDVEVALPQTYEARPGTALGHYTITRVLKTDGTWRVKKG
jgi:hypothetical protein